VTGVLGCGALAVAVDDCCDGVTVAAGGRPEPGQRLLLLLFNSVRHF